MSKELSNRIEELRTLGWSEEGASKYAEKLLNGTNLDISFTSNQILILAVAFSSILIFTLILTVKWFISKRRNNDLFNLVEKEKEKVINNLNLQSLSDLKKEFKETLDNKEFVSIEEDTLVELSRENHKNNEINSQINLYNSKELEDSTIDNNLSLKDSIKNNLSLKHTAEFQNISKTIPKTTVKESKISISNDSRISSLEKKLIVLDKNKIQYLKYFFRFFKETPIDINIIIEHFLLIILLSIEGLFKLFQFFNYKQIFNNNKIIERSYMELGDIDLDKLDESKNITFKERKRVLINMRNSELRNLLKNESNISRLRKSELVDKILMLEFGSFARLD